MKKRFVLGMAVVAVTVMVSTIWPIANSSKLAETIPPSPNFIAIGK